MKKKAPKKDIISFWDILLSKIKDNCPWRTKHIRIHSPKYWKSKGKKEANGLNISAINGKESLIAIDEESSIP